VWPATLIVPVRDPPAFGATENATRPLPLPDDPPVTVIHAAFAAAVHAQVFTVAATSIVPGPPSAAIVCPPGLIVYAHPGAGGGAGGTPAPLACSRATSTPATAMRALRAAPVLASAASVTAPSPCPAAPAVIRSQAASVAAVQAQAALAWTWIVTFPPDAATVGAAGVTVKRHSAASWTIAVLAVLTSIVACRTAGALFAATRYAIDPSPCPLVAEVMTTHCALFDAAHVQSRAAVTVSVPAPPDAGTVSIELVTTTVQRADEGTVTDVCDDVHDVCSSDTSSRRLAAEYSPADRARPAPLICSTRAEVVQVTYLR
jgi:hypothetical protein